MKNDKDDIILQGQSGYSDDMKAFMLNDDVMVIHGGNNELAYLDREQVMQMFKIKGE